MSFTGCQQPLPLSRPGEWCWVPGGRPFQHSAWRGAEQGPELLFPLAGQRTEAGRVLATKTARHFSCIDISCSTLNITARSGFSAECTGSYVTLPEELTLLPKQAGPEVLVFSQNLQFSDLD